MGVTIYVTPTIGSPFILTDDNIMVGTFVWEQTCTPTRKLGLGDATAGVLSFDLDNHRGNFNNVRFEGSELRIVLHIRNEDLAIGYFTIDTQPKVRDVVKISAIDKMARFNVPYVTNLTGRQSQLNILKDVCLLRNVTLKTQSFTNSARLVDVPTGYSCHEIVAYIAQLAGANAVINEEGQLEFVWYGDRGIATVMVDNVTSMSCEEVSVGVSGVGLDDGDTEYWVGAKTYGVLMSGNPFLLPDDADRTTVLNNIYTKVRMAQMKKAEIVCDGFPHIQVMDRLSFPGQASCVTTHKYVLNGQSTITCDIETPSEKGYSTGNFSGKDKTIIQSIARKIAEKKLSGSQQAVIDMNSTIMNSMGYYDTIVTDPVTGAKKAYYHDKPTLEASMTIYTRTEAGYVWTQTGWNGGNPVWRYGVTDDGNAIMNTVKAQGIEAEWVKLGSEQSLEEVLTHLDDETVEIGSRLSTTESRLDVAEQVISSKVSSTEVVEILDGVTIGGRNLAKKEHIVPRSPGVSTNTFDNTNFVVNGGFTYSRQAVSALGFFGNDRSMLEPSTKYMGRFWVKETSDVKVIQNILFYQPFSGMTGLKLWVDGVEKSGAFGTSGAGNGAAIDIRDGAWHEMKYTFTTPANIADLTPSFEGFIIQFERNNTVAYSIEVKGYKYEKGDKVTDWTPAPEDVAEEMDIKVNDGLAGLELASSLAELSSSITQTAQSILVEVFSKYASKSDLRDISELLSTSIEVLNNLIEFRFTTATEQTDTVEGIVTENKNLLEEYIRFQGALIELGRVGNSFSAQLSNTELAFMQDGEKIAFISNNKLYITDAEINNKLTLGNASRGYWDFIPRDNGNLSLKWRAN